MKVQAYFCPACRYGGSVAHPESAHPSVVKSMVREDHVANSPDCKGDPGAIVIGAGMAEEE